VIRSFANAETAALWAGEGVRRLCFVWNGADAEEVEIVDYH